MTRHLVKLVLACLGCVSSLAELVQSRSARGSGVTEPMRMFVSLLARNPMEGFRFIPAAGHMRIDHGLRQNAQMTEPEPGGAGYIWEVEPKRWSWLEPTTAGSEGNAKGKLPPGGIFAPVVVGAKNVMGVKELNKLRADIIKKHTKVISSFVDTADSKFGQIVVKRMFEAADKDGNGTLDREEILAALKDLGFTFVEDKDLDKIMKKADVDGNDVIDFEEFVKATPKTLRTNLVQLAKKNGHDLGFLA